MFIWITGLNAISPLFAATAATLQRVLGQTLHYTEWLLNQAAPPLFEMFKLSIEKNEVATATGRKAVGMSREELRKRKAGLSLMRQPALQR